MDTDKKYLSVNDSRYRILKTIGKGTYGTVYLCEDGKERRIAKELPTNTNVQHQQKEANNEIKVISKLRHPFIIKYYHSWHDQNGAYIIMEYATHGNLAEFMYKRQPYLIPQMEILFYFCQILLGVQHIHYNKIIHRDLKAENVLLTGPEGVVIKLGDFGIARILEDNKALTVIGTPYYIAPELCNNKPYDTKTDVWALGCLLYEMCTHRRAFESVTLAGLVKQITTGNVSPIDKLVYDRGIQTVIDDMLSVEPDKRPAITEVLAKKLLIPVAYNVYLNASSPYYLQKYLELLCEKKSF